MSLYVSWAICSYHKHSNLYIIIAILSTRGDSERINTSLDSSLEEVIRRNVDVPRLPFLQPGDVVPITVRLYLGQTEIDMQAFIDEKNITKQPFSSITKPKRELEQQVPLKSAPKPIERSDTSKSGYVLPS